MKAKPSAKSNRAPSVFDQFIHRRFGDRFEIYLTIPDSFSGDLICFPDFGWDIVSKGLGLDDGDDWDWRLIKRATAKKATGQKLTGGNSVLHIWGYRFKHSKSPKALQKFVPFKTDFVDISDGNDFSMRRFMNGK